jgi:heme oxygenase
MSSAADDEKRRLAEVFPEAPHQPSLSQAINASTKYFPLVHIIKHPVNSSRDLHDSVNVLVVQRFMLGLRDYRLYREGIRSFYHVYSAFERTWAKLLANPSGIQPHVYTALQALYDPRLSRASAIALDLTYMYGTNEFDPESAPTTKEVQACVAHIEKTLQEKPHLVIAYAHIYFMALFAGGKILLRQLFAAKDFFPVNPPAGTYEEAIAFGTNMFMFPVEKGKEESLRAKFKDAMETVEGGFSEEEKTGLFPFMTRERWAGY